MTEKSDEWKQFEQFLINGLKHFGMIDPTFTGRITLHMNRGNLCDIDRFEVGIRKSLTKHS